MQRGKISWYLIAATSTLSLLLLGSGVVLALRDSNLNTHALQQTDSVNQNTDISESKTSPSQQGYPTIGDSSKNNSSGKEAIPTISPADVNGDYHIVSLGDSLTRGTGDETGQGYVGHLTTELQKTTKNKIQTTNLGINGMKAPELLQYIRSPEVQKSIQTANLITMTIGGNDLVQGAGSIATPNPEIAKQTRETYVANLDQIFKEIRTQNEAAPILLVGLYNPFPLTGDNQLAALQILDEWNSASSQVLHKYSYTLMVPTQDIFIWNRAKLLAQDQFHPNKEGYAIIAERILQDLQ